MNNLNKDINYETQYHPNSDKYDFERKLKQKAWYLHVIDNKLATQYEQYNIYSAVYSGSIMLLLAISLYKNNNMILFRRIKNKPLWLCD